MRRCNSPVLVDDSQMFGGLLAQNYAALPKGIHVFGDHAGFVGAGASYATGYALADPNSSVWCTLGDHGLLNGIKALYCAAEQRVRVVFVVCNDGGSVSLKTQLEALRQTGSVGDVLSRSQLLSNATSIS